ncbi:hypothetical protein TWF481_009336 [Arthrobotrys musiformis]|uniref:Uncharacterized protein n=1 Tax=Arthrobotrys musiformis TaxID=47236 RepID=A0AAV9W3D7_9PEZI
MRTFWGLTSILAGVCLLLQIQAPLLVLAETAEIPISALDAFVKANAASIIHFQKTMRDVFYLWDENRVRGDRPDIPLTLDTLRDTLKQKLQKLVEISEDDPESAPKIFSALGFASKPVPKNNAWDWEDTPTNRVLFPVLKILEESSSARHTFWGFFTWANSHLGLIHWFYITADQQTDYAWVGPKLFGGSVYKPRKSFVYDIDKRARDRKQLNIYLLILDTMVHYMQHVSAEAFRKGPKLDLGADIMFLFEDIIKVVAGFRDGVKKVRNAYSAIPLLPGVDDTDVEDDANEMIGISQVPETLQKKLLGSPEYLEGTKILDIPEYQFEPVEDRDLSKSEHGLLRSLPAYVETDFDLLSVPVCSFEEEMADLRNPQEKSQCNIF